LQHADEVQLGDAGLEAVEQAFTSPEDHRRHLQVDLVDDAGLDRLPGARGAPGDRDVLPAGGRLGLGASPNDDTARTADGPPAPT
jgi:hypothetical protein